jgi:hypothetical protein
MLKRIAIYTALGIFAATAAATARDGTQIVNYQLVFINDEPRRGGAAPELLHEIAAWLTGNFQLPTMNNLPRIEFVAPLKLAALRHKSSVPQERGDTRSTDTSVDASPLSEVVAVYNDNTQTIYLPEGWTGATVAERSVLVHEMVHHLQNAARLTYECPAAREKLAYEAQADWLKLHGLDLETEFEVNMFAVLVSSACMN